jgi:hypothetical protein
MNTPPPLRDLLDDETLEAAREFARKSTWAIEHTNAISYGFQEGASWAIALLLPVVEASEVQGALSLDLVLAITALRGKLDNYDEN